jgi:surface protein
LLDSYSFQVLSPKWQPQLSTFSFSRSVNRRRLIGAVLIFSCAFTPVAQAQTTAITNGNIGTAATAWATNPTTAATTYGNIANWNTAAVSNMYQLFYSKPTFNADIGKWNVASVTNMQSMFQSPTVSATAFNVNIGSWNTARVTNMWSMFQSAPAFNQNIASWNTASVSNMASVRPLFPPLPPCAASGRYFDVASLAPSSAHGPKAVLALSAGGCFGFDASTHSVVAAASARPSCGVHRVRVCLRALPRLCPMRPRDCGLTSMCIHGALACRRRSWP